ncbi:hypothetical protein E1A04_23715 [Salmonella enterica subsp. enterica serovar Virchow]|nr:hypothetical protein [Salmonella enterica subsp. enterica serovar Virchow]ECD4427625.1 hypothetical protein [Salmonella enterica subsp. enterica serovar Virchow]
MQFETIQKLFTMCSRCGIFIILCLSDFIFLARYYEHHWWIVIINIIYALFAFGIVILDRMKKMRGSHNSKLITLGVATSAIAGSIMESIFVLAEHPTGGNGTLVIFFLIVTVLIYLLLLLAALLIPIK